MKAIEPTVIEILKQYSFEKKIWGNYTGDLEIIKDLKVNSARIVDIVLDVEEAFDIEIDDDSLENIVCIRNIVEIVDVKTS